MAVLATAGTSVTAALTMDDVRPTTAHQHIANEVTTVTSFSAHLGGTTPHLGLSVRAAQHSTRRAQPACCLACHSPTAKPAPESHYHCHYCTSVQSNATLTRHIHADLDSSD